MKLQALILLIAIFSINSCGQNELPDDYYLPISFTIQDHKLIGKCKYLKGFTFSMDLKSDTLKTIPQKDELFQMVRNNEIKGTLTFPNNIETDIQYEIVNHRGSPDIYMKTMLGYFLWERLQIEEDELSIAIYWWYCPPATQTDLEILNLAYDLLSDPEHWHQNDDRECEDDKENNIWSLFCSLKFASVELAKEYNHHNTAIQTVRFVIDDWQPDHKYSHTLMDFNNANSTSHHDILKVIEEAKNRIKKELEGQGES